ncbi:MAG: NUDIX hydrolase [Nitrospinae bacterium]|nr:NUDIX hydrolase [Nitrospinota bacterium]
MQIIPRVAVDVIIFTVRDEALQALLVQLTTPPYAGMWAFPGGMVPGGESTEAAAVQDMLETTGAKDVYLEQLYTFSNPNRDPHGHVVSVAYFALVNSDQINLRVPGKCVNIGWVPVETPPPLAYDHADMLEYALQRLRWKLEYTNIVYNLLPRDFTLTELQRVYEIILDRPLDKRNFRKKMLSLGLLQATPRVAKKGPHRPARLYRFRRRTPMIIEVL